MIYGEGNDIPVPDLDVLSFLFDSEGCAAKEDTVLHAEADHPEYGFTKAQCRVLTKQLAAFFRDNYGVGASGPGKDTVVAVSSGQSALGCLFYGVVAAGGIYSAASSAGTPKDLARQIKDGPARTIVCSKNLVKLASESARDAGLPQRNVLVLESYPEVKLYSADGSVVCDFKKSLDWERITDRETLIKSKICILYSSGTTGLPKGVLISHMNMVSSTTVPAYYSRPHFAEQERLGKPPFERRTLAHLPTAHVAGVMGYFVHPFYEDGIVYWMPGFDFEAFLKHCDNLRITNFFTVPPIYMAIAKHPAAKDQFRHMRTAMSGAAPLTGDIQTAASNKMGLEETIGQTWGLSETTGSATFTPPGRKIIPGSLGILVPNTRMRLVDDDDKDVKPGEPGEALVKGLIVTQGYHNNDEANQKTYTSDGWMKTGDILRAEGDEFFVVDRKKELIKYKGLQVAPAELEGLIASHDAVSDAAVIGIEQNGTEVPRAYVVIAPPAKGKVSEEDIINFVASKVSNYKRLRGGVKFLDAVPRSPSGKILRKDLRELRKREEKGSKL